MPRRRAVRLIVVVAAVVAFVLVATTAVALVVIRHPLPQTTGTFEMPGLSAPVEVVRDAQGVPQITADSSEDLFRAQGFVQAQDRFFEMDYRRHATSGRLSELVGKNKDALEADSVIRTMGWRRVAEQEWPLLLPSTRAYLKAYAEGVNAYLGTRSPDSLAIEYTVLGLKVDVEKPEAWDPIDSLTWLKAMAWDLRGNSDDELARATSFAAVHDVARVDELFPAYPQDRNAPIMPAVPAVPAVPVKAPVTGRGAVPVAVPVTVPVAAVPAAAPLDLASANLQHALNSATDALAAVPQLLGAGEGVGSNSWVVSGEHTTSGKPILANDPHLKISAPGAWAQVGLHCRIVSAKCPFDVAGFSFAGFPGVVVGHNDKLAWGISNLGADATDFFLERISDGKYLRDGETRDLTTRVETIKVNGSHDVSLTVRSTGHGPIISDALPGVTAASAAPAPAGSPPGDYAVALGWTALTPGRTADGMFALDTARTSKDIAGAAALFDVPSQNIVYATTDGHIGYQAPGKIPVRNVVQGGPVPSDGTWPRPGWDSRYDWQGYVPAADMPAEIDPPEGFIVAANQAATPAGVGPLLTNDWDYGYRSQRIRDVLTATFAKGKKVDLAATSALQLDNADPYAAALLPALRSIKLDNSFDRSGQDLLRTWDGRNTADSPAAAYFAAVWSNLLKLTFWDDLPAGFRPDGGSRWLEVVRGMLERPSDPWWDDRTTVGVIEGRDEILSRALVAARRELTVELGKEPSDWKWGQLHSVAPKHAALGGSDFPTAVRALVNPSALPAGGGSSSVDATNWDASTGTFTVTTAPSMRMVVDLGHLDASTWVNFTGESGHPASSHYTDQFGAWDRGETYPWSFSAAAVGKAAVDRLTLRPGA